MIEFMKGRVWPRLPSSVKGAIFTLRLRRVMGDPARNQRRFEYERRLLPNEYLAELEGLTTDLVGAAVHTGLSPGYPAWNLLYYSLLCSLPTGREAVVVETGTNLGFSSIVMAQAVKDGNRSAVVRTVELDPGKVEMARRNVERAGLAPLVSFAVGDSLEFLRSLTVGHVDFAFLDSSHDRAHVLQEFEILHPLVRVVSGKVYFDNTSTGGVAEALVEITRRFGGNLVQFPSCSWLPPGNAIWQP